MKERTIQKKEKMGEKIRDLRKQRGMTQEFLSEKSEVSVGSISRIENGCVKNPNILTISKLANALGVKVDTLLNDRINDTERDENYVFKR